MTASRILSSAISLNASIFSCAAARCSPSASTTSSWKPSRPKSCRPRGGPEPEEPPRRGGRPLARAPGVRPGNLGAPPRAQHHQQNNSAGRFCIKETLQGAHDGFFNDINRFFEGMFHGEKFTFFTLRRQDKWTRKWFMRGETTRRTPHFIFQ